MATATTKQEPFSIVASINAHDGPIRSVCMGSYNDIITGSQDCMLKRWNIDANGDYSSSHEPIAHNHWITAIVVLHPGQMSKSFPNGLIITGCMDNIIRVFDALTSQPLGSLNGHDKGIISLNWLAAPPPSSKSKLDEGNFYLLSGSWDGTAKIWDLSSLAHKTTSSTVDDAPTGSCLHTLKGHENGVHVLGVNSYNKLGFNIIITTSTGMQSIVVVNIS